MSVAGDVNDFGKTKASYVSWWKDAEEDGGDSGDSFSGKPIEPYMCAPPPCTLATDLALTSAFPALQVRRTPHQRRRPPLREGPRRLDGEAQNEVRRLLAESRRAWRPIYIYIYLEMSCF